MRMRMPRRSRGGGGSQRGDTAAGAIGLPGGLALRMTLASVALAIVVGAVFAMFLVAVQSARDAERRALHSQDVLVAANALELRVVDLETGLRGFVLTRQEPFLEPWQQALQHLPSDEKDLLELVAADTAQATRAREIARAAQSYIEDYSVPLIDAARRDDPSAKTIAAIAEGEARVDAIRADFAQLLAAERRTSVETARASAAAGQRAFSGALVGVAASIALVALYAGYLTRAIIRPIRRAATLTATVAGGDLAARLPETGVGEIGALQRAFNVMGASLERSRDDLARLAAEQAALRRVATLVARAEPPPELFAAVAREIGELLSTDYTVISRYGSDGTEITRVASWSRVDLLTGSPATLSVGGQNVTTLVWREGRPARLENYDDASGAAALRARALGIRCSVGAPITVDGRLWGVVVVASSRDEPLPVDTETRLEAFTELVATALANVEAHAALTASRARIVVTADETRRRIERDLHDGAQQRFVSVALRVGAARAMVPTDLPRLSHELDGAAAELTGALEELRDFARGVHPVILAEGGIRSALRTLARHSAVPVTLDVQANGRLPERVEVAAYYAVSEALTNAAKHAQASKVTVRVEAASNRLRIDVRDDGVGGAGFGRGSGLVGLKDRVEALGGRIALQSQPGRGTSLSIELPLTDEVGGLPGP